MFEGDKCLKCNEEYLYTEECEKSNKVYLKCPNCSIVEVSTTAEEY